MLNNFIRWGHVIRGLLYLIMGLLVLQLILGHSPTAPDSSQAINFISQHPFDKLLLILIIPGLIGYSIWGLIRMTWKRSLWTRLGYLFSALGYASLILPALNLLFTGQPVPDTGWGQFMSTVLYPTGRLAFISVGSGVILAGLTQLFHLKGPWLSKFGLAARSLLLLLSGIFLVSAGWLANPSAPHSFAQVLIAVTKWQFGPPLLFLIGIGLMTLGMYSLILAKNNDQTV